MIEEIPEVPEAIIDAAKNTKLVVFIGAGVSRLLKLPSWTEFAEKVLFHLMEDLEILTYWEVTRLQEIKNPRMLLSICIDISKQKNKSIDWNKLLKCKIKEKNIYDDIYSMGAVYVTTNYDTLVDEAAKRFNMSNIGSSISESSNFESNNPIQSKTPIKIYNRRDDFIRENIDMRTIFHLHGSIKEPETMIITTTDYMTYHRNSENVRPFLESLFQDHTVLFIGYGLEELEVIEILISKYDVKRSGEQHYMLYPAFKNEDRIFEHESRYFGKLGVKLVGYNIESVGYNCLKRVIKSWASLITRFAKSKKFLEVVGQFDDEL